MGTLRAVLVLLLCALLLVAADAPVTDEGIYDQVRLKLARDPNVQGGAIDVKVSKGVVELTGNVLKDKQKERAEKLARKIKGVQNVVNNLKVSPAPIR